MDDDTLEEAAHLLQQVAKIASEELVRLAPFPTTTRLYDSDSSWDHQVDDESRFRSISLSSNSNSSSGVTTPIYPSDSSPLHQPTSILPISLPSSGSSKNKLSPTLRPIMGPQPTLQHWNHATCSSSSSKSKDATTTPSKCNKPTSKFVGTQTPHKLKGILKRKFSWKNFPELEKFLIGKRDEYLHHSNAFNYTSTQKEYNNKLTLQLLDLASSLGYVFERFTFVQVRDRVRCYYKSYLQALKKQQLQAQNSQDDEDEDDE